MSEEYKAMVRRFVEEVQTQHRFDVVDEVVADDPVNHTPIPGMPDMPPTREALKQLQMGIIGAFPDGRMTINSQVAEGDKVVTHKTFEGTHQGDLFGMPPSGKPVKFDIIDIWGFTHGKMRDHWAVADMMSLMQQIGAVPTPGEG